MRRLIFIQARTGSTRLPGKVLMDLAGRPMLAQQVRRLRRCREADGVVVLTTTAPADDGIVDLCRREDVPWFRGSEADVLGRYAAAAAEFEPDVVVRVTADCPLIDPDVTDTVVAALTRAPHQFDYASNLEPRTYPRGLDTEAMHVDVLMRCARMATSGAAREHVTGFILVEAPGLFRRTSVAAGQDDSDLRWTVDDPADLALVRELYARLELADRPRPYADVAAYQRSDPRLLQLNADVQQKAR